MAGFGVFITGENEPWIWGLSFHRAVRLLYEFRGVLGEALLILCSQLIWI